MYAMLIALLAGQGFSLFVAVEPLTFAAAALPADFLLAVLGLPRFFSAVGALARALAGGRPTAVLTQVAIGHHLRRYVSRTATQVAVRTDPLSGVGNRQRFSDRFGRKLNEHGGWDRNRFLYSISIISSGLTIRTATRSEIVRHPPRGLYPPASAVRSIDTVGRNGGEGNRGSADWNTGRTGCRRGGTYISRAIPSRLSSHTPPPVRSLHASIGVWRNCPRETRPDDDRQCRRSTLHAKRAQVFVDSSGPFGQAHALRPLSTRRYVSSRRRCSHRPAAGASSRSRPIAWRHGDFEGTGPARFRMWLTIRCSRDEWLVIKLYRQTGTGQIVRFAPVDHPHTLFCIRKAACWELR